MNAIALFAGTFALVFVLTVVNRGVAGYFLAFMTAFLIGVAYLLVFRFLPMTTAMDMWGYLLGGPLGIVTSMWAAARWRRDDWYRTIELYLHGHIEGPPDSVAVHEILVDALGITSPTAFDGKRVAAILRSQGWVKVHKPSGIRWVYRPIRTEAGSIYDARAPWSS
jgi:hypothetical protein